MSKSLIGNFILFSYLILGSGAIAGLYRINNLPWSSAILLGILLYILLKIKNIGIDIFNYNAISLAIVSYATLFTITSFESFVSLSSLSIIIMMLVLSKCLIHSNNNILNSIRNTLGILVAASVVSSIAFPDIGLQDSGEWRGLFETKNVFARICVILMGITLFDVRMHLFIRMAIYALLCFFIFKTNSDTAIYIAIFMPFVLAVVNKKSISAFYIKFIPSYIFLSWIIITPLMISLGGYLNDFTNGRQILWDLLSQYNYGKQMLGWGFNAFWDTDRTSEIILAVNWPASNAHNIVMDTYLDSGFMGIILISLIIISTNIKVRDNDTVGWIILLLCISLSVTENTFLRPNSILLFLLFCYLENRRKI